MGSGHELSGRVDDAGLVDVDAGAGNDATGALVGVLAELVHAVLAAEVAPAPDAGAYPDAGDGYYEDHEHDDPSPVVREPIAAISVGRSFRGPFRRSGSRRRGRLDSGTAGDGITKRGVPSLDTAEAGGIAACGVTHTSGGSLEGLEVRLTAEAGIIDLGVGRRDGRWHAGAVGVEERAAL